MQIGIRAHDMERVGIEELVANIAKKGFKCTQLALSKAIYEVNTDKGAMTPGFALYLKRLFLKHDVDISVLGCYLNLADPDEEALKKTKEIYKAHIRFASLLGCGVVGTETGAVNSEYRPCPENRTEEALNIFIENLRDVVEYAEKMGVIIAIEPVATHIVYDMKRARKVLDAINSPNLQIIFDPINVTCKENALTNDDMIREAFELCGDEIICIHSKDYNILPDGEVQHTIAGKGIFNYDLLMSILKERKPYIHVLLEDTNPDTVFGAKEYVENKYKNA
jgi:sugar phosphate isomerase/epimerase